MNRRSFLGRAGATIAGLVIAPRVTLERAAAEPLPIVDASVALGSSPLVAAGGLCAPITPYYNLALVERPVRVRSVLPRVSVLPDV